MLVYLYWTIKMMHGPINLRLKKVTYLSIFKVLVTKYRQLLTWFSDFNTNIDEIVKK